MAFEAQALDALLRTAARCADDARRAHARRTGLPIVRAALERVMRAVRRFAPASVEHLGGVVKQLGNAIEESPIEDCDRRAVAKAIVELEQRGVPSFRIARSLIRVGACAGTGTPADIKRCQMRMRKLRQRLRDSQRHGSRRTSSDRSTSCCDGLRSLRVANATEEDGMARKIRKTTTTTVEEFEDKSEHVPDDTDEDEGEEEEEHDDGEGEEPEGEHRTVRRRRKPR